MTTVKSGRLHAYAQDLQHLEYLIDALDLPPIPPTIPVGETVIERLIMDNMDVWKLLLNNEFCVKGYNTDAIEFDPIYKGYAEASITPKVNQDYKYLVEYVRFVNYRSLQEPTSHTTAGLKKMADKVLEDVKGAESFFTICVQDMKITEEALLDGKVSAPVLGYTAWEQLFVMTDDVYSNFVRMIPCVYGWNMIANSLKNTGAGVQGTYFRKYWFDNSINDKDANELKEYLNKAYSLYNCDANWKKWSVAFRQACLFEISFFDAALKKNLPGI